VFVKIADNDFTGVSPTFSNDLTRTFLFTELPDGSLIDTVTTYNAYVHQSNITTQFEVTGNHSVASLTFETFELVSMGNLDTDGEIRLSVDISSSTTLSNVSYYITAYSHGVSPVEMIQPGANVESGLLDQLSGWVVLDKDYSGNSFVEDGNIVIQGLLVHGDTNKYHQTQTDVITMDVPVIEANVFAAPVLKI